VGKALLSSITETGAADDPQLLKNQGIHPETITTDRLASYRAAARALRARLD